MKKRLRLDQMLAHAVEWTFCAHASKSFNRMLRLEVAENIERVVR